MHFSIAVDSDDELTLPATNSQAALHAAVTAELYAGTQALEEAAFAVLHCTVTEADCTSLQDSLAGTTLPMAGTSPSQPEWVTALLASSQRTEAAVTSLQNVVGSIQTDVKNLYSGETTSLKYSVIGLKSYDTFTEGTCV